MTPPEDYAGAESFLVRGVGVNLDAGAGDFLLNGADDADGEVVRLLERLVGFDFEV